MTERLEQILATMAEKSEEQQARILQQQNQITGLIEAIKLMPGVAQPVAVTVEPAVVAPEFKRGK